MNEMDQTEFDFSENQETEQDRLEREVLAAGGRVGKSEGRFAFGFDEAEGYKRGDEHREVEGLYYWDKDKSRGSSRWLSLGAFSELREKKAERQKGWCEENRERLSEYRKGYYEENKEKVAEYHKGWYKENKEKVAETAKRYREENRERLAEGQKRYREENKEKVAESHKRYYEENKEKVIETAKRYYEENRERCAEYRKRWREENREEVAEREKRYREENKEKRADANRKWRKENPEKVTANHARRRAKLREALDPNANKAIIESRYEAATYLSDVTGYKWHVDHTIPLDNGGKHHEDNLQVVPGKWNLEKGANHNNRWIEDSNIYRYATAVEKRFEEEAKKSEEK